MRSGLAKTRKAMEAAEVDVIIVSDPSNMAWLTGYDGWSFYVHQCVVVGPDGDPVWFGRGQDANGARRTAWLSEDTIIGYDDNYVQSTERHPMDYLSVKLDERGWGQQAHRRRDGQLLVLGSGLRRARETSAQREILRRHGAGELAARRQVAAGTRLHAQGRPPGRAHAQHHRRQMRGGLPQMRPGRRYLRGGAAL